MMAFPFDCNVTLFHRCKDGGWRRAQARGASFAGGRGVSLSEGGLAPGGSFTVRIPEENMPENYLPPGEFRKAEPANSWTLECGDFVCKGLIDGDITLPEDAEDTESQCFTVTSWKDNRGRILGHLRIDGE